MTDKRTLDNLRYWCNCTDDDLAPLLDVEDETILMLEDRLKAALHLIALYESERELRGSLHALVVSLIAGIAFVTGVGVGAWFW